ncbi:choice-of-anchor X domain-containing protein [Massilia sp. S19_KUP03_FR1]|uniref:choice-of-anchor X domain-containing protein n=1 Tax=Massilia sp. S19_KUP03_FR1 TaxID=3025503 RepID=UPI002FCD6410
MPPEPAKKGLGRRLLPVALVMVLLLVLLAAWYRERQPDAPAVAVVALSTGPTRPLFGNIDAPAATSPAPAPARRQLLEHYQLAERTLCSYEQASQYPVGARPMAQNADQAYPNLPVTEANPMRLDGGATDSGVLLQTSQSRVHMASGEVVAFTMRAVDPDGATLPLVITRALAAGINYGPTRANAQVALAFADDGVGADPVAGDGAFAAVLAPAQTGLASFDGTIRTRVAYSVNGKNGSVAFDVIYSPLLPAVWTGAVREARENGSLNFYLKAEVRVAGRYIVSGRVDDAQGRPFALLTFNDVLPSGPNEVRLSAFGKLLRDGEPALPLTLRDVDGYLLRENADPDRALMPRLEGRVATSRSYPLTGFSDAPFDGEERRRYLTELGKDVRLARAALLRDDPDGAVPASACTPR